MRSMNGRRTAATRSTTATRLYAVGTGGHGNVSVTAMPQSIHSVRSVTRKDCCIRWRRYTTSCRWQRAGRMTRETLCRCASPAMRGFMRSAVTGGISINLLYAGPLWRFLPAGRGGRNLHKGPAGERAWGQTHKNRKSNGGLPRPGFPQNKGFQGAAAFDFRSIFSKKIKETG